MSSHPTTPNPVSVPATGRPARRAGGLPAVALAVLGLALLTVACGDGDPAGVGDGSGTAATVDAGSGSTDATDPSSDPSSDPSTDSGSATDPADATTSTTTGSDTSTTSTSSAVGSGDGLPGEAWEGFADAGDRLAVLGVAHDDELNVRSIPGNDGDVVATAAPTATDLVATGRARMLARSLWYEVTVDGVTGWVSIGFVAFEGATDDATAEFLDGAAPPETETMVELGELVAAGFASEDPPSRLVQSVAPTVGDLGEVTFDVVGLGDDAGAGYRLHVFATPTDDGEGFALKSIERTEFCLRGVSGELCV